MSENTIRKTRGGKTSSSHNRITSFFLVIGLLLLVSTAGANEYEGGIPLQTVKDGVVSGGLYFDSYPGFGTSAYKAFTLPSHKSIEWARVYVGVYCGHKQNNYQGTATVNLDTNGDGKADILLGNEELNVPYSYPGERGTGPVSVGSHGNRVTSDYLFWYDVREQVSGNRIGVDVKTAKINPSFDGRIKFIALVVAYNDEDGDKIYYWINQGHDPLCYLDDNGYTGETSFDTSRVISSEDREYSAILSSMYMASEDGIYTFNGDELAGNGAPQGPYFGSESWDVTDSVSFDDDSTLQYQRSGDYFKLPLAFLTVGFKEQPEGTLEITSNPPGAQIILDGEETGKTTNQTLTSIPAGEHTVQVMLLYDPRYRELEEKTVNVINRETSTIHFEIPQINGTLDISSEPDEAWIYLDGKNTSVQSYALLEDIIIGDHTILLKKAGYLDANATFSLEEDDTETVELILQEDTGNISINANNSSETGGYSGKSLSLYNHSSVRGGLAIMDSEGYSGLLGKDMSAAYPVTVNLTPNATVRDARLYVYTTWSYDADTLQGKPASLRADLNGNPLTKDRTYSDRKGNGTYDYPVETHCYTIDGNATVNQMLLFTITNNGEKPDKFAVYGVMLLVIYDDPAGTVSEYWIGEGADTVYANPEFGISSDNAVTRMTFSGTINTTGILWGELYVVSTASSGAAGDDNRITFNDRQWQNQLTSGSSGISIARMNVSGQVRKSGNKAGVGSVIERTKGDYMENRNLILVITGTGDGETADTSSPAEEGEENGSPELTLGGLTGTANLTGTLILATGPVEETLNQSGKYYSIRVLSNPPGAMISADYAYCGKTTPDTIDGLDAGNHTISIEMPGFDTIEERICLTNNQTLTFDLQTRGTSVLSAEKIAGDHPELMDQETYGGIFVTSNPDNWIIYVDGKNTGSLTPNIIYGLSPGKHTVQVKEQKTTPRYLRGLITMPIEKKEVWVEKGMLNTVSFRSFENPYLAGPVINSTTYRNSIFTLNGKLQKFRIPQKVNLQASQNYITIMEDGMYITHTIFSGNDSEISVEPRDYTLNSVWVESDPPGADIYVDGFATGMTTPYQVDNMSDQAHLIMVSKPGYYPLESTVYIAGSDLVRRFVLEPYLYGTLTVESNPAGGKIYINGKDTGKKTPYSFQYMDVGEYTVKVVQNSTKALYEDFIVEPYRMNELNLTLKKKK